MYLNLVFNTDALNVLLKDMLIVVVFFTTCILCSALVIHLFVSFFAAIGGFLIDGKDIFLMRDIRDYEDKMDWVTVYMGISMWTWISIGIGFLIISFVKLLFAYGVLYFR